MSGSLGKNPKFPYPISMSEEEPSASEALKLQIKEQIQDATWASLENYHDSDELLLVASNLDLVEVGLLCCEDQVESVKELTKSRAITKLDEKIKKAFSQKTDITFEVLNLSPYIFIKRKEL